MKKTLLSLVDFYQNLVSLMLKNILGASRMCRFSPTCSEYAKIVIKRDGVIEGLRKTAIRIMRCQPFFSF